MNRINRMLDEIVKAYRALPEYRALALIGSHARGTAKEWSGIDLMGVCFQEPSIAKRKKTAQMLADPGTEIFCCDDPYPEDRYTKAGCNISIYHVDQDMICDRVSSIEKRRRLESTILIASLFESQILWDAKNQLVTWKKAINPMPEEYKIEVIPQIFAEVASVVEDLAGLQELQNSFYVLHELIIAVEDLYEIIFLLNGQYLNFSHKIDNLMAGFKLIPPKFHTRLNELLSLPSDARGMRVKWRLLAELTKSTGEFLIKNGKFELMFGWEKLKSSAPFLFKI